MPEPTDIAPADEAHAAVAVEPLPPSQPSRDVGSAVCANCGESFRSRFCPNCGERRIAGEDYSLRHFLGEAFNILTSVESNLFRSFASLVARPGKLTAEYFKGRRKSYLKPLQLFVFCNVIFFFAQSMMGSNTLTTPLYVHLNMLPHQRLARRMVEEELLERKLTYDDYRTRFDAAIEGQAKTLVIVMVPIFALLLHPLYRRKRRYYVEHLVFATHFFAFFLLLIPTMHVSLFLVSHALRPLGITLPAFLLSDLFLTIFLLFVCTLYLFIAQRRAYGQGWAVTALKCLALTACVIGVVQLYRLLLFFTTFYLI